MKKCPQCGTQYSDVTLSYCLQDGTPLIDAKGSDTPTVVIAETETVAADRIRVPLSDRQDSQVTRVAAARAQRSGSKTLLAVAATILVMLVLFAAAGVGAWLYFRDQQPSTAKNTANAYENANRNAVTNATTPSTPKSSPSATPNGTPATANPPSVVDDAQIRSDVSQKIDAWRAATESKSMSNLRVAYASMLDFYYTKQNISSANVIADKMRAFSEYDSIRMNVSVKSITPDAGGNLATAILEKDWTFSGIKPFCGVVRSELQFRRINGQWLIVGERDVPGTFRRTC